MSDELDPTASTPVERFCEWLPRWWSAVIDTAVAHAATAPVNRIDQAAAIHRDVWKALGVDLAEPSERHALAVGLAYGARFMMHDVHAAHALATVHREWGSLGEVIA